MAAGTVDAAPVHGVSFACSPIDVNLNRSWLLTTKENNMLKRLTRKLITLSVLVFALATVSFTSASSTNQQLYCYYDIVTAECPTGWVCCDDTTARNCWCA